MKKPFLAAVFAIFMLLPVAGYCGGDLDVFLSNMNVEARADLGAFKARMSATFGVPTVQVEAVLGKVREPADAYMVMKVGQVARQPQEVVLDEYRASKGKGWGVISMNLGIKPGSPEFHELKKGWGGGSGKGKKKGKNK
jgi:hypothetical protein